MKASEESNSREGSSKEERDSHLSQQNQEHQHKRPMLHYNTMFDVQEDEFPKEIKG
jgi:hypothetical protein